MNDLHHETAHRLAAAVIELSGGRERWELADLHFSGNLPLDQLVELATTPGQPAPSRSTVHRWVSKCWATAGRFGIRPATWTRQAPGRAAGKQHATDPSKLYLGRTDRRINGVIPSEWDETA